MCSFSQGAIFFIVTHNTVLHLVAEVRCVGGVGGKETVISDGGQSQSPTNLQK